MPFFIDGSLCEPALDIACKNMFLEVAQCCTELHQLLMRAAIYMSHLWKIKRSAVEHTKGPLFDYIVTSEFNFYQHISSRAASGCARSSVR